MRGKESGGGNDCSGRLPDDVFPELHAAKMRYRREMDYDFRQGFHKGQAFSIRLWALRESTKTDAIGFR